MAELNDDSKVLTIRFIIESKKVGCIIGKSGKTIKRMREDSGAIINISRGFYPERIVTITGLTNCICRAFVLIYEQLEKWYPRENSSENSSESSGDSGSLNNLHLIVSASLCDFLMKKRRSKIKKINKLSGVSIQVASKMLPNSTEKIVTVSGTIDEIIQCIYHICNTTLEFSPEETTILYQPNETPPTSELKPQELSNLQDDSPMSFTNQQAYSIHSNFAASSHSHEISSESDGIQRPQITLRLIVPESQCGAIIGKRGSTITEIREETGAFIKIESGMHSNLAEREITVSGSPEEISQCVYRICTIMEKFSFKEACNPYQKNH